MSTLAENVIALIVLPKTSQNDITSSGSPLAPLYEYNSRDATNPGNYNQLPPVIQVIMVVIDESSAVKLGNSATPPANFGLDALFQDASKLDDDLRALQNNLSATPNNAAGNTIPLRFEIFHTEVGVPGAKWNAN